MITMKTNLGTIKIVLHADQTPMTVKNFLQHVTEGFYNGTLFHRVINDFMIQGGGFTPGLIKKDTTHAPIINEARHAKPNVRGTLSMARTSDPHSATTQFFINVKDNAFLNFTSENGNGFGYCVFGEVIEGMDIVDTIKAVATQRMSGYSDVPVEEVIIEEMIETEGD